MSQADDILAYLKEHPEGITAVEALQRFGCFRLAARVSDLRRAGHDVVSYTEAHEGGTHARYRLGDKDRRFVRTMDEHVEYMDSPHARNFHQRIVPGCKWCQRHEEENSRFVIVRDEEPEPQTAPLTLW